MPFKPELVDEMNILIKFKGGSQGGIKVHKTAPSDLIQATERLFEKGMVSEPDGGFLTQLGQETVEHAQSLHGLLAAEEIDGSDSMKTSLHFN